jgi:ubiquinone/menaquinone biosynthesis C-methylase UbiE
MTKHLDFIKRTIGLDRESKMNSKQSNIFLESEGDGYFQRNKTVLGLRTTDTDTIKRALAAYKGAIKHICEIGCGDGVKLNNLCDYFGASGSGVDPSSLAVKAGNDAYKNVRLKVSTAANLPFNDSEFDLVYFGFCLYLVDRVDIYKAVSEADRVLKNGGFLAIFDFEPAIRHKKTYHHKAGIFSYKNSYANFFTSGGHYYLVAKDSFSHQGTHFHTDSDERVSISILYKEIDAY